MWWAAANRLLTWLGGTQEDGENRTAPHLAIVDGRGQKCKMCGGYIKASPFRRGFLLPSITHHYPVVASQSFS